MKEMKKLGYRIGVYTDHMVLFPLSRSAWHEDMLNLDSNGDWLFSSGMAKQTKISRMVALQRRFNAVLREKFAPTLSYSDQITCPPCWRYTDYDSRAPEAGKFSAAYRVFAESLRQDYSDFGPVLSEGKTQMFFAGLCDNYAQPQRADMPLLPNFNLRKIHPMNLDCGYELSVVNWKASGMKPERGVYRLLCYEYAYGNMGHLYGPYHGEPYDQALPKFVLQSYFLIQPLQRSFAGIPVQSILYNVQGNLAEVEKAIQAGSLERNQVKIVYQNHLEVAVNLHQQDDFQVALHSRPFSLPPEGFAAATADGTRIAFSIIRNNRRADYMRTPTVEYRDGEVPEAAVQAAHAYLLDRRNGELVLTPAPFEAAENVSIALFQDAKWKTCAIVKCQQEDITGHAVGTPLLLPVQNGRVGVAVDGQAFRYCLTPAE